MGAEHRTKIANSKILKHLIEHAEGEREMTSTQVSAALGLLDRVMPKLQSTSLTDGDGGPLTVQLVRFADQGSE